MLIRVPHVRKPATRLRSDVFGKVWDRQEKVQTVCNAAQCVTSINMIVTMFNKRCQYCMIE